MDISPSPLPEGQDLAELKRVADRLRSPEIHDPAVDGPVDPKACYRTRPVALFNAAADAIDTLAHRVETAERELAIAAGQRKEWREVAKAEAEKRVAHKERADRLQAQLAEAREALKNPPPHDYWRPGQPDCPKDIKAGNGELHTLRCKRCGLDSPRDQICRAALGVAL